MDSKSVDLTKGSIMQHLWALAWPMMLTMFLNTAYNIVDTIWVAKLSSEAVAATSISQITLFVLVGLGLGLAVGTTVLIGINIGARNIKKAEAVLGQSYTLAAIMGVVFSILAFTFKEQLLYLGGATGTIYPLAEQYFTITSAGAILMFLMFPTMFAFRAQGDAITPTIITFFSVMLNAIIDPIFIFGWFGMPALGIQGAAYVTLVAQLIMVVVGVKFLMSDRYKVKFRFASLLKFDPKIVFPILGIGFPAAITQIILPAGFIATTFLISRHFFEAGAIAFSIAFRIEFFSFIPAVGFGSAAQVLIAQNFGGMHFRRVKDAFVKAALASFGIATAFGVLLALFAPFIFGYFTGDSLALGYATSYAHIVPFSYGFFALLFVVGSAFQGFGRSWPAFWVMFAKFFIVSVPLTYLAFAVWRLPIVAAWVAIVLGNILACSFALYWIWSYLKHIVKHEEDRHLKEFTE